MLEFTNTSQTELPILEEVRVLDLHWPCPQNSAPILHGNKGSVCVMDDFMPFSQAFETGANSLSFAPSGGRPSDGAFPFFNLQGEGEGVVIALGWTGQWKVDFARLEWRRCRRRR